MYSPLILSLSLSQTRGSASAAEPPGCSSPSLSLLDAMAATLLLLLAPERLRLGNLGSVAEVRRSIGIITISSCF